MKNQIKTSVIIPVYNTKPYLKACIESVLAQTQKEIEIILVDDGSTDGSTQIIKEYEARYSFIKAIFQSNQKQGAARNAGVRVASGKYIYFLDSDDFISENLLEDCYCLAEKNRLDFVMFDAKAVAEGEIETTRPDLSIENYDRKNLQISDRVFSGIEFWKGYFNRGGIYFCAVLLYINADFLKENGLEFEEGVYYEDNDWAARLYTKAKRIFYLPEALYYRRYRNGSTMTENYNEIHWNSCIHLFKKQWLALLNTEEPLVRDMNLIVLLGLLDRAKTIFSFYCQKKNAQVICDSSIDFLKDLLNIYEEKIVKENKLFQGLILSLANRMCNELSREDLGESPEKLEDYKKELIRPVLQNYPLSIEGKTIGIYGTGAISSIFFSFYKKYRNPILASVFFIDTNKKTGSYQGYPLYNVKDITEMRMDCVIIASTRYKEEMVSNLQNVCVKLPELLFVSKPFSFFV